MRTERGPVYIGWNIVGKDRNVVAWMINGIIGEINSDILPIKAKCPRVKNKYMVEKDRSI